MFYLSDPVVSPGTQVTATVVLTRADTGAPIAGETVDLSSGPGQFESDSKVTDMQGSAVFVFDAPTAPGNYTLTASFSGDTSAGYAPSTDSVELTVQGVTQPPSGVGLVVGSAVVVTAVGIAILAVRRRRR